MIYDYIIAGCSPSAITFCVHIIEKYPNTKICLIDKGILHLNDNTLIDDVFGKNSYNFYLRSYTTALEYYTLHDDNNTGYNRGAFTGMGFGGGGV
jgi:hypothetical protein